MFFICETPPKKEVELDGADALLNVQFKNTNLTFEADVPSLILLLMFDTTDE